MQLFKKKNVALSRGFQVPPPRRRAILTLTLGSLRELLCITLSLRL
jgi:hypothetical protein